MKEESKRVGLKFNIQKTKILASGSIASWQVDGEKVEIVADYIFLGTKITVGGDCSCEIKRRLLLGRKAMTNLASVLKSRDITLPTKVCLVKPMAFPVVMWVGCELDHKEGWALKNWCLWTAVLEKTLVSPLDSKEIKPVNSKGNQHWIFIGRTDVEAEASMLWPHDAKSQFTGKDPEAGKEWGQEEKRATEDEMAGWYHRLNGHEFEQTPGDSERKVWCAAVYRVTKNRTQLSNLECMQVIESLCCMLETNTTL